MSVSDLIISQKENQSFENCWFALACKVPEARQLDAFLLGRELGTDKLLVAVFENARTSGECVSMWCAGVALTVAW